MKGSYKKPIPWKGDSSKGETPAAACLGFPPFDYGAIRNCVSLCIKNKSAGIEANKKPRRWRGILGETKGTDSSEHLILLFVDAVRNDFARAVGKINCGHENDGGYKLHNGECSQR